MTQEDKDLLLKDLCARLPYGIICQFIWSYNNETTDGEDVIAKENDSIRCIDIHTKEIRADYYDEWVDLEHCKPYLRPISSMTEEEEEEWRGMFLEDLLKTIGVKHPNELCYLALSHSKSTDWLNAYHFDYRGLIEKGLALPAPKDTYKSK